MNVTHLQDKSKNDPILHFNDESGIDIDSSKKVLNILKNMNNYGIVSDSAKAFGDIDHEVMVRVIDSELKARILSQKLKILFNGFLLGIEALAQQKENYESSPPLINRIKGLQNNLELKIHYLLIIIANNGDWLKIRHPEVNSFDDINILQTNINRIYSHKNSKDIIDNLRLNNNTKILKSRLISNKTLFWCGILTTTFFITSIGATVLMIQSLAKIEPSLPTLLSFAT